MVASLALPAATDEERIVGARMDDLRIAMEAEMLSVRQRAITYLNWYSPPYNTETGTHDAWPDPIEAEDVDLTRANFPIARAVVDIWAALEAYNPPTVRAEAERVPPFPPALDQATEQRLQLYYGALKEVEGIKSNTRSTIVRRWLRDDAFPLKHWTACRRKDLYGFSWMRLLPNQYEQRPMSYVVRNPTNVFPLWSDRDPDDVEAVLCAYQKSATKLAAQYPGLFNLDREGHVVLGVDNGRYLELNNRYYDSTRTMAWVEELWWIDRQYDEDERETDATVHFALRVAGYVVKVRHYKGWRHIPYVYFENTDERDSYGWSDIASVIDINDEFNRRLSQEGDIIGSYSAPRFQLLNSTLGRQVDMPGPFELIALSDQERIEQILTRIDVYPTQQHFSILMDLLHRVAGLPPIVWGLIANAQTSGRALTASWKATEARLAPKLMRNEQSLQRYLRIALNFAERYNWANARAIFRDQDGDPFRDFRWDFPPMEPRDFQEVTMNEITKRDAGLTSTLKAIRATGDEAAEDTLEEVLAESLNIFLHPEKVQAFQLAQRTELDNIAYGQQLGQQVPQVVNPQTVAQSVGEARQAQSAVQAAQAPTGAPGQPLPPTLAGAPGNAGTSGGTENPQAPAGPVPAGPQTTAGTLMRGGQVSNQYLQTRKF